ncbi:hypothetical protein A8M77_18645 [Variovorax sp. JS1663]|nr:hypothetical protein A8M77_18645 [Variovorax sp. JS1663]
MRQAVEIRFLGTEASPAVEAAAREKAMKLERFCGDIIACRIGIELAHKHQHQGRRFAVRIQVTVPGQELTISRVDNEDIHVALRDAFDGMRRQLEDVVRRNRDRHAGIDVAWQAQG